MDAKREQALVGLFVIVASGLLVATIFALSGAWAPQGPTYHASFKFAGGLEPGAIVRYAGGPKVGRVESLRVDPRDPTRIDITFSVGADTPVKTDSKAKIFTLGALSDNYLEITPGSPKAPQAVPGSFLASVEFVSFADITAQINALGPDAQKLLENLNQRATELKEIITRVNDLLNARNRENVGESLSQVRGMLTENRPKLKSTMTHVEASSAKLGPLMEDFKKTVAEANKAIDHIDALITDNRQDLRASVQQLRQTLASANDAVEQLNRTLNYNSENIDELLDNMRHTAENLKEFTDLIKSRPSLLIRAAGPPERKPGQPPKP